MSNLNPQQFKFTWLFARLILELRSQGYEISVGACFRSPAEEQADIDKGLSHLKTPNDSKHCLKLAVDLNIFKDGALVSEDELVKISLIWKGFDPDCEWGGDWIFNGHRFDTDHFQLCFPSRATYESS